MYPLLKKEKKELSVNHLQIACLVNRSRTLRHPTDKKHLNAHYYAHRNYTPEEIPLGHLCEETLLKGFHFV